VAETTHTLSIVIPALNEEEAIGSTIRRALDARAHIREAGGVEDVEVLVVSDGSSDRTEEIARSFEEVTVLVFERNRGYGAAIQCGFAHARGDLLAFLDADGTCDPLFFADLCRAVAEQDADVVLGSRMGPGSEMPWIRSLGNTIFAWILGVLSRRSVGDTASGMRVIRRSALPHLYPLPAGLHFTPAMSARILMEGRLRLAELPMAYAERVGRSKLSVVKDGVRFLTCIVQAAVAYRPARPLLLAGAALALSGLALATGPGRFWLAEGRLEEWMIYRLLLASLLATTSAIVVCAALVAERIAAAAHGRPPAAHGVTGFVSRFFTRTARRLGMAGLLLVAFALVAPGIADYAWSGRVELHWSRVVLSSLLVVLAAMLGVTTFLIHMVELIEAQRRAFEAPRPPDRLRPARGAAAPGRS
jgi:hypothetical protein